MATGCIEYEIACDRCGYSLRGLTLRQPCPECGHPIVLTATAIALRYASPTSDPLVFAATTADCTQAARRVGLPTDAVELVCDSFRFAQACALHARPAPQAPGDWQNISPKAWCSALRDFAAVQFGGRSDEILRSWGLTRGSDLGRVVHALVEEHVIRPSASEPHDPRPLFESLADDGLLSEAAPPSR